MKEKEISAAELQERISRVRLFLCDVDGILTDASVWMGSTEELKRFHIMDGLGLRLLQKEGIKVGWISNRSSFATTQRAMDLKVDFVHQANDGHKVGAAEEILAKTGLQWENVCYMGDDVVDLGVLKRAGFAATVRDAIEEAKHVSHYVTKLGGGHGAVREVVDLILKGQGKWDKIVEFWSR